MFSFFNIGLDIKSYCLEPIISAKDNLKLGLTYIFPRTYSQCFPLLDWEIPNLTHWTACKSLGQCGSWCGLMTSMSNAKVWLDFLCHIREESRHFFYFYFFYKSMQFRSGIPATSWPFCSKVKNDHKQKVWAFCKDFFCLFFCFQCNRIEMGIVPLYVDL